MKNIILLIFLLISTKCIYAQTAVVTAGTSFSNSSGSVSYSIGQVAYSSISNLNGSLSQGVQQVYQISTLILEEKGFNFSLSAYPNPTMDNLTLRIGNYQKGLFTYRLLDTEGKLLSENRLTDQETIIVMQQLPTSTYFVEVHHESKKVQSFKIIKNQ